MAAVHVIKNSSMNSGGKLPIKSINKWRLWTNPPKNWQLYLLVAPTLIYFFIFNYIPMYGVIMAFEDYSPLKGYLKSPWVGFENFQRFFESTQFWQLISNTLGLSVYSLFAGFPVPIVLAFMLNYLPGSKFRRFAQTITYAPHFISNVVLVGIMMIMLSPRYGIVNNILALFNIKPIFFMAEPRLFQSIYVWSGIWQNAGWNSIIYFAALSSIDPNLHESAKIDGASKLKRILYIDLPGILPTIITLFILNTGHLMSIGFEKAFLMQNALNQPKSEIISIYVYKVGLIGAQFSFASAVGLFNSVINCILLITMNFIAKRLGETSLW